ncbi:MAG: thiamine-phosphate kinase [Bacteroidales bacterium]|nr:thiamine-phosphate kinase [Bacteroidales bacterium]
MPENTEPKRTEISALGEFGLIDHLTSEFPIHHEATKKAIGDDAAVIEFPKDEQTLISTDLLLEGIHFDLSWMPLSHLGYKAVIVNLSDIAAMNAIPRQILVSIGVSNRFPLEALEEIYTGIRAACEQYKIDLIGGDTSSSAAGLAISITVIGSAKNDDIVYRSGAKENDLVCVSGDLGSAYSGLLILQREKKTFEANPNFQPDLDNYEVVIGSQLKPKARVDMVELFKEKKITPTSMIDISDGLASELFHICKNSDCGCSIYEEKLPIDIQTAQVAEEFEITPVMPALNGGEDYELLFTLSLDDYEKVKELHQIIIIGHISDKKDGINLINKAGQSIPLKAQGWDSFRKE